MKHKFLPWLLAGLLFLSACSADAATGQPAAPDGPRPYATTTPSPTPDFSAVSAGETPIPTPTPFTYTVVSGDTLSGIALKFGVSLEALMAANPDVSPSTMPIGQALRIPSGERNLSDEPTPTPAPLSVTQVECYPTAERGLWCFVLVHNDYPDFVENLSAQVLLLDANGEALASQPAFAPLNILPPGEAIPLTVFFPPEMPANAQPQAQLLTAVRLLPGDSRYLPVVLQNTLASVDWTGRTAQVSGQVSLPQDSAAATQVWVVGVAYDKAGDAVGVRRWEANSALAAGGSLPFAFTVSSLGPAIGRVALVVEARP